MKLVFKSEESARKILDEVENIVNERGFITVNGVVCVINTAYPDNALAEGCMIYGWTIWTFKAEMRHIWLRKWRVIIPDARPLVFDPERPGIMIEEPYAEYMGDEKQ